MRTRDKFERAARIVHNEVLGINMGCCSIAPMFSYWRPVDDVKAMATWKADNDRIRRLADKVDGVFPHLYTFYDDGEGWVTAAKANIAEAKQHGKPVYAFIWPEYQGIGGDESLQYEPHPAEFWKLQLKTVKAAGPDGV